MAVKWVNVGMVNDRHAFVLNSEGGVEAAHAIMAAYDWCKATLGPALVKGEFVWVFEDAGRLLDITDDQKAVEFRLRWC